LGRAPEQHFSQEGVKQFGDEVGTLGRNVDIAGVNAGVGAGGLFAATDLDPEVWLIDKMPSCYAKLQSACRMELIGHNRRRVVDSPLVAGIKCAERALDLD
jgi:hypothetical protein